MASTPTPQPQVQQFAPLDLRPQVQGSIHRQGRQHSDHGQAQVARSFSSAGPTLYSPFDVQPVGMQPVAHLFPLASPSTLMSRQQVAIPPLERGRTIGHGNRNSESKTSMDMRTHSWVDKLLASPSRESSDESKTTRSFGGLSNMSDV